MTIHVVQRGETVSAIAAGYGVDPARVMSDNDVPPDGACLLYTSDAADD